MRSSPSGRSMAAAERGGLSAQSRARPEAHLAPPQRLRHRLPSPPRFLRHSSRSPTMLVISYGISPSDRLSAEVMPYRTPSPRIPNKLPLDDPRWGELTACWREGAKEVPSLLERIAEEREFSLEARHSAWARLYEIIYHQNTCYTSTFAAFPYVVELALEHPPSLSVQLWIDLGHIAATYRDPRRPIPGFLSAAFHRAVEAAEPCCLGVFLDESLDAERASFLAMASIAFSGHPVGLLLPMGLIEAEPELECDCPVCEGYFLFVLLDEGLATYRSLNGPLPKAADPSQPRTGSAMACAGPVRASPWDRVAELLSAVDGPMTVPGGAPLPQGFQTEWREELAAAAQQARCGVDGGDVRCVLSILGALLALKGHVRMARNYLRLTGGLRCPICGYVSDIVDTLEIFRTRGDA